MRPDQEPLLLEAIHAAAYKSNTLGLPKMSPEENIDSISRKTLMTYLKSYHSPDRMVLAGVGIDHDQLVESAQVGSWFLFIFLKHVITKITLLRLSEISEKNWST